MKIRDQKNEFNIRRKETDDKGVLLLQEVVFQI